MTPLSWKQTMHMVITFSYTIMFQHVTNGDKQQT